MGTKENPSARNVDPYGNTLVDPKTGEELEEIALYNRTDDPYTSIVTKSTAKSSMGSGEREKALGHFRARANKHTRSDEGKHQRVTSIEREIKSINGSKGGQERQD
ncbi:MAG: hypothetical protein KUG81_06525 [Gammaproteobacteria bacterium]|nr:hypothetical protein [Gammaproteobacteria bacterium]